jgi:hypothetical protein
MPTYRTKSQTAKEKKIVEEIERKYGKTPGQLFEERDKRVRDAIALREPDRVPVVLGEGVFAAKYAGLPLSSMYYDIGAYREACRKLVLDFEPDLCQGGVNSTSGQALTFLDTRFQRWPGGNLPPNVPYQFVEGEYMKVEEYDLFLNDPSDFTLRFYLPRLFGVLAPVAKLPPFRTLSGGGLPAIVNLFATPEFRALGKILYHAGQEQAKAMLASKGAEEEMNRLGFPSMRMAGGVGAAPFDTLADYLRGMRGAMLDMYRCPDKLLAACDKILEWRIAGALPAESLKLGKTRLVLRPLHKGADGFMSLKQFERFYWPTLKAAVLKDIELGYTPRLGWQGTVDSRLEYFLELPKGKVFCWFEHTDMARAKAVLGNHICIAGNVPVSMLCCGSPQDVDEYCKRLIRVCGKGGGFLLTSSGAIDDAKPQNVRAMVESVKKYRP